MARTMPRPGRRPGWRRTRGARCTGRVTSARSPTPCATATGGTTSTSAPAVGRLSVEFLNCNIDTFGEYLL